MAHISKAQFAARALDYLQQVETTGEPLIITENGKPSLEVRPFQETKRDPREILRGSVRRYDRPFDPVDDNEWEALR